MTPDRTFSGSLWETEAGYCRAIRTGPWILVSGTTPMTDDGSEVVSLDAAEQAHRCWQRVEQALKALSADMRHVVRTRMFVTDAGQWPQFAAAHRHWFGDHPPAATLVQVSALIHPDCLIEVEADAYVS